MRIKTSNRVFCLQGRRFYRNSKHWLCIL